MVDGVPVDVLVSKNGCDRRPGADTNGKCPHVYQAPSCLQCLYGTLLGPLFKGLRLRVHASVFLWLLYLHDLRSEERDRQA